MNTDPMVIVRDHPRSPGAEAFRMVRTNMAFMDAEGETGLWVISSSIASEGKSTVVANLGVTLAAVGRKTLIVDGDLRRPSQHRLFKLEQSPGLSHILTGQNHWTECVVTAEENLDVIPSGPLPPNPAELLQTAKAGELWQQVREQYSTVLVDSPPVLMVADSQLLARHGNRVVLVVKAGFTRKDALQEAHQTLVRGGAKQITVILNQVRPGPGSGAYAYYYTYHGRDQN